MEVFPKKIEFFIEESGRVPFADWFDSLTDKMGRKIIRARLERIKKGLLGDCKGVGPGVTEARIDYGPGYRIYFGQVGNTLVVLLCGGDKSTQVNDIIKALEYWMNYKRRLI